VSSPLLLVRRVMTAVDVPDCAISSATAASIVGPAGIADTPVAVDGSEEFAGFGSCCAAWMEFVAAAALVASTGIGRAVVGVSDIGAKLMIASRAVAMLSGPTMAR